MASLVLMATVLVAAAVSVTARRGFRSGMWRFPLAVSLATGFFGSTAWLAFTSDNELQYWGDEALADEWQAEVRSDHSQDAPCPDSGLLLVGGRGLVTAKGGRAGGGTHGTCYSGPAATVSGVYWKQVESVPCRP